MCGFRKGCSTQQAIVINKRWKNTLDQNAIFSKTFNDINHIIIAKLGTYGFDTESLKLIRSYLTNSFQKPKVNTSFSRWSKLFLRVPQGSALGVNLFNIYINDLFYLNGDD